MRSKKTMNESAVMPTATIRPAMPGRVSVKPALLASSSTSAYVVARRDEQGRDHDQAEAAVVEQAVEHHQDAGPRCPP